MKNIRHVLLYSEGELSEMLFAIILVVVGGLIFIPFLDTFKSSASYYLMARITNNPQLSELIWGSVMLFSGLLHLISVVIGYWRVRKIGLVLSTFVWLSIGISFLYSNPLAAGAYVFTLFGIYCGFFLWKNGK